jgi:hypothetical protein
MTAAPVEDLATQPLDSLEMRWMVPGTIRTELRDWFARFPARTETRQDVYLLRPPLPGLSVKLRNGNLLDVKSYRGSRGTVTVPGRCQGRLESWRKWSFPYSPGTRGDGRGADWITVRKSRRSSWIPLPGDRDKAAGDRLADTGCAVELAEADPGSEPWWSVGFEASGSPGLLDRALRHAVGLVFARQFPDGTTLSLDTSRSYAQWLHERTATGATGTPGRA